MMKRTGTALLAVLAMVTALNVAGAAHAQEQSWVCKPGGPAAIDSATARELSHNPTMTRVLQEYRARWDASYIKQQCDAAAAGEPSNIGCLKGRRDWDAINVMVPANLRDGTRDELRPLLQKLRDEGDGVREAFAHCRELGIIK